MLKGSRLTIGVGLFILFMLIYNYVTTNGQAAVSSSKDNNNQEKEKNAKYPDAPEFTLNDLDGNPVSLSDYSGKVVAIDFWATWCGPCRRGIPEFVEMQSEFGEENFVILGISVDQGDLSVVGKFAKEYKINYPVLFADRNVVMAYGGISGVPTTFIVDRKGKVRDMVVGYRQKIYFENVIKGLL